MKTSVSPRCSPPGTFSRGKRHTGFMLCFGFVNAAFQSFFHMFFYRFLQTLFMCKCMFIIIGSLLVKVDCVAYKWKL